MNRDNWTCRFCGDTTTQLEIHHIDYVGDLQPWDYPADMLVTLCHKCHQKEQERPKHEEYLIQSLRSAGFLACDILALSTMLDTRHLVRTFLLRETRKYGGNL